MALDKLMFQKEGSTLFITYTFYYTVRFKLFQMMHYVGNWIQESKSHWYKQGDLNTYPFHIRNIQKLNFQYWLFEWYP